MKFYERFATKRLKQFGKLMNNLELRTFLKTYETTPKTQDGKYPSSYFLLSNLGH